MTASLFAIGAEPLGLEQVAAALEANVAPNAGADGAVVRLGDVSRKTRSVWIDPETFMATTLPRTTSLDPAQPGPRAEPGE